jgi:hypothetical protein
MLLLSSRARVVFISNVFSVVMMRHSAEALTALEEDFARQAVEVRTES